jgi:hypothetical protein
MLPDSVALGVDLGGDYSLCGVAPTTPLPPATPPPGQRPAHGPASLPGSPHEHLPGSAAPSGAGPGGAGGGAGSSHSHAAAPGWAQPASAPAAASSPQDSTSLYQLPQPAGGSSSSSQELVVVVPRPLRAACPLLPGLLHLPRLRVLVADRPCDAASLMTACVLERAGVSVREHSMHSVCVLGTGVWEPALEPAVQQG